ncbi:MAG: dihydroneopterin triphosphate diphosphatase [Gammaproteobacteria bacterium]|nr:dihydroneopterin triphosphate diphosphatase [Gammaproteobacteria bacterium]
MSLKQFKRPESVLVVVYTLTGQVLLLRRADDPSFWQSVTGSLEWGENPRQAAERELSEETGLTAVKTLQDLNVINRYPILPRWRARYAADVQENSEHAFVCALAAPTPITLNPREHAEYAWFPFVEAAEKVTSWTNREIILRIKTNRE